jgi:hypothetical protein
LRRITSRWIHSLLARIQNSNVPSLTGRCTPSSSSTTFAVEDRSRWILRTRERSRQRHEDGKCERRDLDHAA